MWPLWPISSVGGQEIKSNFLPALLVIAIGTKVGIAVFCKYKMCQNGGNCWKSGHQILICSIIFYRYSSTLIKGFLRNWFFSDWTRSLYCDLLCYALDFNLTEVLPWYRERNCLYWIHIHRFQQLILVLSPLVLKKCIYLTKIPLLGYIFTSFLSKVSGLPVLLFFTLNFASQPKLFQFQITATTTTTTVLL